MRGQKRDVLVGHEGGQRRALGVRHLHNAIGQRQHKVQFGQRLVVLAIEQRLGGQIGLVERQRSVEAVGRVAAEEVAQATGGA